MADALTPNIGTLVIFISPNGEDHWTPVKPDEVPAWVQDPDNMARLVAGEVCMCDVEESGSNWFMALPMPTPQDQAAFQAAQAKRARRMEKRKILLTGHHRVLH